MGNNLSSPVAQCLNSGEVQARVKWLEEQCAALAAENERLRQKLRDQENAEAGDRSAGQSGDATIVPLLKKQGSLRYGNMRFSRRTDDEHTLTLSLIHI